MSLELETHIIEKIRSLIRENSDIKYLILFGSRAKSAKLDELDLPSSSLLFSVFGI